MDQSTILDKHLHDFNRQCMEEIPCVVCNRDSFLSSDPETWATNEAYLESEAVVKELRVVSDTAERGVALVQKYSALHTKNEEQMQFALQVVKEHRKHFPDSKKLTILQGLATSTSTLPATDSDNKN